MSHHVAAATLTGAGVGLLAAPYLARLTVSVPDRDAVAWWRGAPASRGRLAATAAVAVVLGALAGRAGEWTALLPALVALALVATPLTVIDFEHHRLPNRLVFTGLVLAGVLLVVAAAEQDAWSRLLRAALGALAVFAVLYLLALVARGGFGLGDVKLGGLIGAYLGWHGWIYVYYGVFAGFVLGAVVAIALLVGRRATMKSFIPFGPMLILGTLLVLAFRLVPSLG